MIMYTCSKVLNLKLELPDNFVSLILDREHNLIDSELIRHLSKLDLWLKLLPLTSVARQSHPLGRNGFSVSGNHMENALIV